MSEEPKPVSWKVDYLIVKKSDGEIRNWLKDNPEFERRLHHEITEHLRGTTRRLLGLSHNPEPFVYRREWRQADVKRKYYRKPSGKRNRNQ